MIKRAITGLALGAALVAPVKAEELTFVTWNVGAAWDGAVEARGAAFDAAAQALAADIYVLQEVTSLDTATEIARMLGLPNADVVVTDFASPADQGDDTDAANVFFHLEMAVISRVPVISATELEFDRQDASGPFVNDPNINVARERMFVPGEVWDTLSGATQRALRFGRGALRVELTGDIVIYAVHAKSEFSGFCADLREAESLLTSIERASDDESGLPASEIAVLETAIDVLAQIRATEEANSFSQNWITNAEKREAMFAVLAERAAQEVDAGKIVLVMGDYNIPLDDPRSGTSLDAAQECNPARSCLTPIEDTLCVGQDGLDESHFLIGGGLIPGFDMIPLTAHLDETLTGTFASAVDHIYVAGAPASQFVETDVKRDDDGLGFGSDHLPVYTVYRP